MQRNQICAAMCFAAVSVFGGEAVLNRNDINSNPSAFNGLPAYWTPNVSPASTEGASTDFIVKNGLALRTPDGKTGALTFGGQSLTLGASDRTSAGYIYYKSNGYKITIPNLIVYRGGISSSTSFTDGGYNTYVAGAATLYTTYDDPFVYSFDTRVNKLALFEWALTGDETTAVKITGAEQNRLCPRTSQASTYSGSWIFGANQYIYVDGGIKANDAYVFTSSQTVFGKPLSAFNPKSVFFDDGCSLRYEAKQKSLSAADNRGITIADNGTLTLLLVNAITLDWGYPIAGKDATTALSGDGTLKIRTSSTACLKPTETTKLALVGTAAAQGGVELANGQVTTIGEAATDRVSANGAKLTNAMLKFAVASDGSDAAQLRLSGDVQVTGVIGLGLSGVPSVSATTDIPVVVIDKSVTRTFTEADFDPWGVTGAQVPNAERVVLSTNGDGDTVVSIRVFPFVRSNRSDGSHCIIKNANEWTPNGVPSAGHNYIVWNNNLRTGLTDKQTYVAPGDMWVFYSTDPATVSGDYQCKEEKITFNRARLLDGSYFATAQGAAWTMTWGGNLDIRTTAGYRAVFSNGGMKAAIVSANISGRGKILAQCVSDGNNAPYAIRFTGSNAAYVGTFAATNSSSGATQNAHLEIAAETNLGGNPESFAADAFRLGANVQLDATAALVIDDANRGVTLEGGCAVNAAEDIAIKTPIVAEGGFAKKGTGTFAYGAGGFAAPTEAWSLAVEGGTLKPQHAHALKGATVTFAAGTTLAVDAATADGWGATGLDLRGATIQKADERLAVRFDAAGLEGERRLPLATFATEAEATAFAASIRVLRSRGYSVTLTTEAQTVSGEAVTTLFATVAKSGLAVLFR